MNLSWACQFANVWAVMSLLKLFQVQGKDPSCDYIKTRECEKRKCTNLDTRESKRHRNEINEKRMNIV